MPFETLITQIGIGLAIGVVSAIMGKLASGSDWSGRSFAYSLGIGIISAIAFIKDAGAINEANVLSIFVTGLGGQFIINKATQMANRLKEKVSP